MNALLAWYFVAVWGSGYGRRRSACSTRPPFTFLTLRFAFGLACLLPIALVWKPAWPKNRAELGHLVVAGLLVHAVQLGGSFYAQYLGMSAGVAALILACQPLATAVVVSGWMGAVEGFKVNYSFQLLGSIAFLVIFSSILAVSVLNLLMRRGEATRVASMMYLPPVFAVVVEAAVFGIVPGGVALAGMAVTCAGVAMTVWSRRWRSSISSS